MKRLRLLAFLLLVFSSCQTSVSLQKTESVFYTPAINNQYPADSSVLTLTKPYKDKLDLTMQEVLAQSEVAMEKGQPESRLGNFVADLCFQTAKAMYISDDGNEIDFCVLNNGGLRNSLPSGPVTRGNVYELMPFDNELVVVTMSPDSVRSLLGYIAEKGGVPVSNLRMKIENGLPVNVTIAGAEPVQKKNYKVVTSDYLANGGDAMIMFSNAIKTESLGIKVRDAIMNTIETAGKNRSTITAATDGRISK